MWVFILVIAIIFLIILLIQRFTNNDTFDHAYSKSKANIDFFWNGKKLYQQFFNDVQHAKKYVCISFFIVKSDEFSKRFYRLLCSASERGVSVYLMVDRLGSLPLKNEDIQWLKNSGVHVIYSNPIRFRMPFRSFNRRNHRKISIIDGKVAYLGGYNIGDEYINDDSKFSLWRDYHIRITGEVVENFLDVFTRDWKRNTEEALSLPAAPENNGQSPCLVVPSSNGTLEKVFIDLIKRARHSISIGTPYFIPSEKITRLMEDRLREGVNITILYPHESDHLLVKEASMIYLQRLQEAGADVRLFVNGFYHAKVLFIDNEICDIGTANFDRRSLYSNEEINLIIYDSEIVKHIYQYYEKDLQASMPLYKEWLKQPNTYFMWLKKFLARLCRPLL